MTPLPPMPMGAPPPPVAGQSPLPMGGMPPKASPMGPMQRPGGMPGQAEGGQPDPNAARQMVMKLAEQLKGLADKYQVDLGTFFSESGGQGSSPPPPGPIPPS
jgi:hypothetical protein